MKRLLKNGKIINVFTGEIALENVLVENDKIIGVGDYTDEEADMVQDVRGCYLCPGFIDGHIHIESTMLSPSEFARASVPHGTTAVVADPHEIANVCGKLGIQYMLAASENIPLTVYLMLPSCVPSTGFDESGAILSAEDLEKFYDEPRVLGLAEVMNYPGVIAKDQGVLAKIAAAQSRGLRVNGHAPLLSGKDLDAYISQGIGDDHECSSAEEAKERISKGQRVMIRQGTVARNLEALLPLFEEPWAHRCLLVADDKHPADLLSQGHIDEMIRLAVQGGKSPVAGIRMATLWAAEYYGLRGVGAIAPGYQADILILEDLDTVAVRDVYRKGIPVVEDRVMVDFDPPVIGREIKEAVYHSFHLEYLTPKDFQIHASGVKNCRVIQLIKNQLLTDEWITSINFDKNNGIDTAKDILKIAVVERHNNTGHKGLGFISGIGLQKGAIASSVSHDSHNLIIIGTSEEDMALAGNRISEMGGGCVVVDGGAVVSEMPLPLAGLMADVSALEIAKENEMLRNSVYHLGVAEDSEPFMSMAFVSLPVIPHLKMTTKGLVNVDSQQLVSLFV